MRLGRILAAAVLALLAACSAPDYTPVREWARAASLVADHPGLAPAPSPAADGVAAMQEALATYLAALGRMADDGVLPYLEDPFVELAARARSADPAGAEAVATMGRTLRQASRGNWRAPAMRDAIRAFDPAVQALVAALARALAPAGAGEAAVAQAAVVRAIGQGHAMLKEHAAHITREEVVRMIRAEEDRMRRVALALPRPGPAAPP